MRQSIAILTLGFVLLAGSTLILGSGPWFWFRAGLAFVLYGQGLFQLGSSRHLVHIRQRVRLSFLNAMRLWFVAWIAAGCFFIVGAVSSLDWAPAVIVAFAALCWVWAWSWILRQARSWAEPHTSASTQ